MAGCAATRLTQRSLVEVLLSDADHFRDLTMRRIDAPLDDDDLVHRIADALAQHHPLCRRRDQRLGARSPAQPTAVAVRRRLRAFTFPMLLTRPVTGKSMKIHNGKPHQPWAVRRGL